MPTMKPRPFAQCAIAVPMSWRVADAEAGDDRHQHQRPPQPNHGALHDADAASRCQAAGA